MAKAVRAGGTVSSDILSRSSLAEPVRAGGTSLFGNPVRDAGACRDRASPSRQRAGGTPLRYLLLRNLYWQQDVAIFTKKCDELVFLLYHIIFRTKDSLKTINLVNAPLLYNYIFGICRNKNCKLYRIGGVTDHIHIFAGLPPTLCVSDFVKLIKTESNKFMKNHRSEFPKFGGWGTGYCALTYSSRDREMIINYIKQQPEHLLGLGYADELRALLEENDVSYNLDYFDKD